MIEALLPLAVGFVVWAYHVTISLATLKAQMDLLLDHDGIRNPHKQSRNPSR
jgi:hypothetical protein